MGGAEALTPSRARTPSLSSCSSAYRGLGANGMFSFNQSRARVRKASTSSVDWDMAVVVVTVFS